MITTAWAWIRRRWLPLLGVTLLVTLLLTWLLATQQPTDVPAVRVTAAPAVAVLTATGQVQAHESLVLSAPVTGRIRQLPVDEGQMVAPGSVLAVINPSQEEAAVQEARARLRQSEANRASVVRGARPEERARLRAAVADAADNVNQSRAALASAEASLADARQAFSRIEAASQRTDGRAVSAREREQAATQVQTAEQAVAQQRAAVASADARLRQAEAQLAQANASPEDLRESLAARDIAAQALRQSQARLQELVLRSPRRMQVTDRVQDVGDLATPGQPILRLADPGTLEVVANVEEADLGRVRVGMTAYVVLDAQPETPLPARVTRVGSRVNPENGTVPVTVVLTGQRLHGVSLLPGMTADVNIVTERLTRAMVLPASALVRDGQQTQVYVVRGGRLVAQAIQTRALSLDQVAVQSGLRAGEWVVVQPAPEQLSAERVRPQPFQPKPATPGA